MKIHVALRGGDKIQIQPLEGETGNRLLHILEDLLGLRLGEAREKVHGKRKSPLPHREGTLGDHVVVLLATIMGPVDVQVEGLNPK